MHKKDKRNKSAYASAIKLLILIVVALLIIVGLNTVKVKNIEVCGGEHYTAEELIEKAFGGITNRYTAFIWAKQKLGFEQESIPFVEKIDVEIIDKNSVRLIVYDKSISGCVLHMGKYMYFDREGIVVDSSEERMAGIPVVTGVNFKSVVMNSRLEVETDTYFTKIMNLTQLLEKYEIDADEINFDVRSNVTVYVNGSQAELGFTDNYDYRIHGLKNVLKSAGEVKYRFDMRNYSPDNTDVGGIPINN